MSEPSDDEERTKAKDTQWNNRIARRIFGAHDVSVLCVHGAGVVVCLNVLREKLRETR